MSSAHTSDAMRAVITACVLVTIPVAAWEVFLRLDSQVVGLATKLWFLPLLACALIAASALVATFLDRVVARLVPGRFSTWLLLVATAAYAAALFAGEYVGVTYYHSPELVRFWPVAAAVGFALMLVVSYLVLRISLRPIRHLPRPRVASWLLVAASLLAISSTSLGVARRQDLAEVTLRRNTVLGRIGGSILSRFKPSLTPPATVAARLPDRPSVRTVPASNVILISIDTLRTDAVSPYNAAVSETPHIQRLADRSVVFDDAFAPRPTSAPSIASLMTGLYPARHGVRGNGMKVGEQLVTLPELLAREEYRTAGFVSNVNFSEAFGFNQGFEKFAFFEPVRGSDGLIRDSADPQVVDAALEWARAHRGERLFLWAHLISPHSPYIPPPDLRTAQAPSDAHWFNVLNMPSALARVEERQTYFDYSAYRSRYASEVMSIDLLVGRLLDGLDALGLVDGSHIIFVSDHGEAFGEGDVFGHGRSLHPIESRVVFFWQFPDGSRGGSRISQTVQLVDLLPTLRQLVGQSPLPDLDGRDLSGVMLGESAEDEGFAFIEAGHIGTLGRRGLKYAVRTRQRAVWLDAGLPYVVEFDRLRDPSETRSRRYAGSDGDELFDSLQTLATAAELERRRDRPTVRLDDHQKEQLRALGYLSDR